MKVLHLISGGDTGGAKTHLISLMKGFTGKIDAKVICFMEDTFYYDLKKEGIDIEVIEQKSRMDLSVIGKIKDIVEKESYDLVHCHGARANFIAMFLKRSLKGFPMVTTVHSDYRLDFKDRLYKKLIYTSLNSLALKSFKNYIAISDNFKDMLVERGFPEDSIYVCYNGIDFDEKLDYRPRKDFLGRYGIEDKGQVIVGIAARLDKVKDHETFIRGAELLLKERSGLEFLIAGNGNDEERLKKLVKDLDLEEDIHFLGFVEDQYSFFNAIDINCLTSLSESFPYVILEGGKMKKPIVSTEVGGVKKLIEEGLTGYSFPVGDYRSFSEKLASLLDDEAGRKTMGENLYKKIEKEFSSDAMARTHISIYEKIINKGKK